MRRPLLPWWIGPLFDKGYHRKPDATLSREERATVQAITRTFVLLLLGWLVVETAASVLLTRLNAAEFGTWVPLGSVVASPLVGCGLLMLARRIVASRHPERTATADTKAVIRLGIGTTR